MDFKILKFIDSHHYEFDSQQYTSLNELKPEELIQLFTFKYNFFSTGENEWKLFTKLNFNSAGGTAQTTSDISIVEIADVYLTNTNTNLRLGGIGSGQWTSLEKTYVVDPAKHTIVKFSTKKYWVTGQQYYVISLNNFTSSDSLTDTRTWWNLVIVEAKVDGSLEIQTSGVRIHSTNDVGYNSYQGVLENQETVANNIINFMSGTLTLDNAMRIYEEGGEDPITEFTVQNVYYQGQVQV